jgi:hypothetical protein
MLKTVTTAACVLVVLTTAGQVTAQTLKGQAAFGDWRTTNPE